MLIIYIRVESIYRALKQYLGSKKTQRNFFTTWINIEDILINQIYCITVENSSKHNCIPLDLDRQLFCSIFGIVI